jgi:hypothetical protein
MTHCKLEFNIKKVGVFSAIFWAVTISCNTKNFQLKCCRYGCQWPVATDQWINADSIDWQCQSEVPIDTVLVSRLSAVTFSAAMLSAVTLAVSCLAKLSCFQLPYYQGWDVCGQKQLSFPLSCSQLPCFVVTVSAPSLSSHALSCLAWLSLSQPLVSAVMLSAVVLSNTQGAGPLPFPLR